MEHKLYAPLMLSTLNNESRKRYLEKMKKAGTDFVFVALNRRFGDENEAQFKNFAESLRFFENSGFLCGAWISTIGLCGRLSQHDQELTKDFDLVKGMLNEGYPGTDQFCFLSKGLFAHTVETIRLCIEAGAKMIMLDDDLCLSLRGLGCACDKHMELFYKKFGSRPGREEIYKNVTSGAPNRYRSLWMETVGDSLKDFCARLRAEVDAIDPTVRMGFCSGYTSWDEEGADALTLAKILAGSTRPFLRLTGAPYWVWSDRFKGQSLASIIEFVREQTVWCDGVDIELFDENDSYPRPRHIVPAAYCEIYDQCIRFAGDVGAFKYMYDYSSGPDYEDGYLRAHLAHKPLRDWIDENALENDEGIIVIDRMRKLAEVTLPEDGSHWNYTTEVFRHGQRFINKNAIPVRYTGKDNTCVVFGECARFIDPADYKQGIILDLPAALILQQRGFDVGLKACVAETAWSETFAPDEIVGIGEAIRSGTMYRIETAEGACVLSEFVFQDKTKAPSCYRYDAADGTKYLVYAFDGNSAPTMESPIYCSYYRQQQLVDAIRAMGGSVPVVNYKNPNLYAVAKSNGDSLSVWLANINADTVYAPEFELEDAYTRCDVIGGSAHIEDRKLVFDTNIPAYECVGFRLYK